MKKLVFACCAVVVIGSCMALGGWAAGGQLYGSYYNGALHPVSETLRDATHFVRDNISYHTWWEDGVWHSGWFDDDEFADRIEDAVNDRVDTALAEFDKDRSNDWDAAIGNGIQIPRDIDVISALNLDFSGDCDNNGTINIVSDTASFDVSGADIESSTIDGSTWSLALTPNGSEQCVIYVPYTLSYSRIFLNVGGQTVDIAGSGAFTADQLEIQIADGTLRAEKLQSDNFNIHVQDGKFYADQLKIGQMSTDGTLDLTVDTGSVTATLVGAYEDASALSYQVDTAGGAILLDGVNIAGGDTDASHASQKGESGSPLLRASVGSGTVDLLLDNTGAAPMGF